MERTPGSGKIQLQKREHAFWTIPDKPEEQSGIPRETQYRKGRESRTEQTWLDIQQIEKPHASADSHHPGPAGLKAGIRS